MKYLVLVCALLFSSGLMAASSFEPLKSLTIQDAGRLKPLESFARESMQLIYGKQTYKSKATGKKEEAISIVFSWFLHGELWNDVEMFQVNHAGLREALNLDAKRTYFNWMEVSTNSKVPTFFGELNQKNKVKEKLTPFYQAISRLRRQIYLFQGIKTGYIFKFSPDESGKWVDISKMGEQQKDLFAKITKSFTKVIAAKSNQNKPDISDAESVEADKNVLIAEIALSGSVTDFKKYLSDNYSEHLADKRKINLEVTYHSFQPFLKAWILYLLAVIFFGFYKATNSNKLKVFSLSLSILGFAIHTIGFAMRVYIIGRPPVTNMYETILWVPWGAVFFAFILLFTQKNYIVLVASLVGSILCLILADISPTLFDPSLQPLVPVLRSTFWLSTHVLMITISYGAFLLSWAVGNATLFCYMSDENAHKKFIADADLVIYRTIQIGVVLLAGGIILGGIWADYSWGRFWGWDPKETWALIALLGYLALLHSRLVRTVQKFGLAAGAVVSFSLVIMAWYGVNYVLGAGLHAYGFGAGGVEYVAMAVTIQMIYVGYVYTARKGKSKN